MKKNSSVSIEEIQKLNSEFPKKQKKDKNRQSGMSFKDLLNHSKSISKNERISEQIKKNLRKRIPLITSIAYRKIKAISTTQIGYSDKSFERSESKKIMIKRNKSIDNERLKPIYEYHIEEKEQERSRSFENEFNENQNKCRNEMKVETFFLNLDDQSLKEIKDKKRINLKNNLEPKRKKKRQLRKIPKVFDSLSNGEPENPQIESEFVILPSNKFKEAWNFLISLLIYYSIFYVPLKIAFEQLYSSNIDTIIDLFFCIDLVLNFFSAYYDENEVLVVNLRAIVPNYLKTWFVMDFISSFPFDLVANNSNFNQISKFGRYYRLLKWVRVFRGIKINKQKKVASSYFSLKISAQVIRFLKFLIFLILLVHIVSCFYIFLAHIADPINQSWIFKNSFQDQSNFDQYIASLYFTLTTILTIGYGDIRPDSMNEYGFILILLSVGSLVYSYTLSSMGNIFEMKDSKMKVFEDKEAIFHEINKEYEIPKALYKQIKKSILFLTQNTHIDFINLVTILPSAVKNTLFMKMYQKQIFKLRFFRSQPYEFIVNVIPLLRNTLFLKDDVVVGIGEFFEEMYLIFQGCLSFKFGGKFMEFEFAKLVSGNHYGDINMFLDEQPNYNLCVKSKISKIMILKKNDYAQIKLNFAKEINLILKKSLEIYRNTERRKLFAMNYFNKNKNFENFKFIFVPSDIESVKENLEISVVEDHILVENKILEKIEKIQNEDILKNGKKIFKDQEVFLKRMRTKNNFSVKTDKINQDDFKIVITKEDQSLKKKEELKTDLVNLKHLNIYDEVNNSMKQTKVNNFLGINTHNNPDPIDDQINSEKVIKFNKEQFGKLNFKENLQDFSKKSSENKHLKINSHQDYFNPIQNEKCLCHCHFNSITHDIQYESDFTKYHQSLSKLSDHDNINNVNNNIIVIKNLNINYKHTKSQPPEMPNEAIKKKFKEKIFHSPQPSKNLNPLNDMAQRKKTFLLNDKDYDEDIYLDDLNDIIYKQGIFRKNDELLGEYFKNFIGKKEKNAKFKSQLSKLDNLQVQIMKLKK